MVRVGAIVVLVVLAGVTVYVSWVPRSVKGLPNSVVGVSHCPPALDDAVDGHPFVASFRFGRRDRGRCVVGAGDDRGKDVTRVGAS